MKAPAATSAPSVQPQLLDAVEDSEGRERGTGGVEEERTAYKHARLFDVLGTFDEVYKARDED